MSFPPFILLSLVMICQRAAEKLAIGGFVVELLAVVAKWFGV